MQYVAAVSGKGWEVDRVKEQLLQSNPVLEGVCLLLYFFVHLFLRTFFLLRGPLRFGRGGGVGRWVHISL